MSTSRWKLGDRGLLVILLILLGLAVIGERVIATRAEQNIPLSSTSDRPGGASALFEWLTALGFEIETAPLAEFDVPDDVGLVFLLSPTEPVTADEWNILKGWVSSGGVLIVSGSNPVSRLFYTELGYELFEDTITPAEDVTFTVEQESPFLTLINFDAEPLEVESELHTLPLKPTTDQVVHLSADDKPLVVSHPIGLGHVILAPETSIFSNKGLSSKANRNIVLNLVAQQGAGGKIWVDEWHHGIRELAFDNGQIAGPVDWLRFTASGRAVLLVCLLLFVFMLLNGRHLGRPQPLPESLVRRGPADYVDALANLTRQTGNTDTVAQHTYQQLRRTLIKRFRLDPNMNDQTLIETLQRVKSADMAQDTADLLNRLKRKEPSESDLIALQADIDQFRSEYL